MHNGFDAAFCPSDANLAAWRQLGYDFIFGYHGGRAEHVWPRADFERAAAHGYAIGSYWVSPSADAGYQRGVDDGNASLDELMRLGLSGIALLDVENGISEDNYIQGFYDATVAGSCQLGVYGSYGSLKPAWALGVPFYTILARWAPFPSYPHLVLPDWHVWQYGGGSGVDYNVAVDGMVYATLNP